ncbi:hypothetical protein BpHYR1_031353 [Brachionus plicatilis]|uniref:Uncharacterized protein n=1 Tax=Brachionus plicatilis TaxID=10195 RepID=A0A3M7QZB1_BRAPC|nr:hypothetical protein BpHYR1_031353 [Brachionus plicatilis]
MSKDLEEFKIFKTLSVIGSVYASQYYYYYHHMDVTSDGPLMSEVNLDLVLIKFIKFSIIELMIYKIFKTFQTNID